MGALLHRLDQLAPSGLQPGQSDADEPIYLWPCNLDAWHVWWAIQAQWRTGMEGREGLDYAGVRVFLDEETDFTPEQRREIWRGIRAAEQACLEIWAEQRRVRAASQKH